MTPKNRLLSHAPRRRLQAEFVRDHALAISGLLVDKRGGPGVNPYQPAVLFGRNAIGASGAKFTQGKGNDLFRRSLYTYWKRQIPAANMRILGADGRTKCRTRRERTNTPLQALVLLNDPQFVEAARVLAERSIRNGGNSVERTSGIRLSSGDFASGETGGNPYFAAGIQRPTKGIPGRRQSRQSVPWLAAACESRLRTSIAAELAAYAAVCSLILNLDESISTELD